VSGWLAPVPTLHSGRVRLLLGIAGTVTILVSGYLLVLGLSLYAFLAMGIPFSVLGFLGLCLGLAVLTQGIMPWDTAPKSVET
jgi:hypothetical protein